MLESLKKGDKIVTSGGIYCEVLKTEEDFIKAKLNEDTIVKISREFISRKVNVETKD